MDIEWIPGCYSICRLAADAGIPHWIDTRYFYSVTRTSEEVSVVCVAGCIPDSIQVESDWSMLKVAGPINFATTGVLSALIQPLAEAKISIFALSTYDTDYLLVKKAVLKETLSILEGNGIKVKNPPL